MNFKKNVARAMTAAMVLGTFAAFGPAVMADSVEGDPVTVTATVEPILSFGVGADAPLENAGCASFVTGGTVALGVISPSSVASSSVGNINVICVGASTNSTTGYAVTVVSANGALASASTPADTIPATPQTGEAVEDPDVDAGEQHYGLCFGSNGLGKDIGWDDTTPAGVAATPTADVFDGGGTCLGSSANDQSIGTLTTTASTVLSASAPTQNNWSTLRVKAAISTTTPAHNDYADTLTFTATSTF